MNRLPTEVVDIIYKFVHKNMVKDLNEHFKKIVNYAKFYHVLQEHKQRCFFSREIYYAMSNIDFTECCFRYPKSIKYFKI